MSEAPNQEWEGGPYKWFKVAPTYTNNSLYFVVIVGSDFGASQTNATILFQVKDASGNAIDTIVVQFTTSGEVVQLMPRKMLIPPGYVFTTNASGLASGVLCKSLDMALRIL